MKTCPTVAFSYAILMHIWNNLWFYCITSHFACREPQYALLAYVDVSYLGQNLPHYDVCLFRAQYRKASRASIDSHCASHSCGVKRDGHAQWSNVVKKVIFKNLSASLGASGRQAFRNIAIAGCAYTAWKWQLKHRLSHYSYFYTFPLFGDLQLAMNRHWSGLGMWDIMLQATLHMG